MPFSESYHEYVMEQLAEIGPVRSRKMFGGVGIYLNNLFFALIAGNRLYFKVDESNREDYTQYGMKPFRPFPDQKATMSYYEVPVEILEDREQLADWAARAIDVARRAAQKKLKP